MNELTLLQIIIIATFPVLLAIILHEIAHGWVAKLLGDDTASRLGRLSLNPLKHIDPVGTIVVPIVLIFTVGVAIGWAKPVPINWANLHQPKRDMAVVAIAGPFSNLLMAIFWGFFLKLITFLPDTSITQALLYMGQIGILVNVLLMVFNLLPIPPLDGGRVAVGLLPLYWARRLSLIEPFGFFIIVGLMLSGVLWFLINPLQRAVYAFISAITGIN
jgi:Zn-dependent protease